MKDKKIFGSVCSGIEAASVAWEQLGWECAFVSEIDHFPSAVLKHRYPDVPNFGDFTTITYEKVKKEGKHPVIDVLIGGTPCQSFSVAGLRKGLESENGNLALEFVRLLSRLRPRWFVWENVPGVFSSSGGSDFASILAGFTGRVVGVPAEGWRNSGSIEGIAEAYDVSWRVLDAQYFGVAQRRRRVFVVGHLVEYAGCLGDGFVQESGRIPNLASAVLFESDCLQGNPEPRREKREGTSSSTQGGVDSVGDVNPTWWNGEDLAATLTKQNANGAQRMPDKDNFGAVIEPIPIHDQNTISLNSKQMGLDVGDEIASTILSTDYEEPQVVTYQTPTPYRKSTMAQTTEDSETWVEDEVSNTLNNFDVGDIRTTHAVVEPQYYESHPNDSRVTGPNDIANSVTSRYGTGGGNTPLVAQPGEIEPIAVDTYNQTINTETTQSLSSAASDVNHYGAVLEPKVFDWQSGGDARGLDLKDTAQLQRCQTPALLQTMAIRRLTPIECERLQGFPNNWTKIPYRGKHEDSCPDGPRYKACGNSMATPVIKWIGERIDLIQSIADER